ncbi:hypothetical protein Zmor_016724 [Zophobas morio]|uniref:Citrate transporter-like domain-containing protein n=1 Tax=Zophobas morio TaxID=2755281 RepID=A0AA38IA27_9CUCU|nr:hypothetical protein Zmor_016724 [Zophobas morio]
MNRKQNRLVPESEISILPCIPQHKQSQTDMEDSLKVFLSTEEEIVEKKSKWKKTCNNFKVAILVGIWVVCSCALMTNTVKVQRMHQVSISTGQTKIYKNVIFRQILPPGFIILEEPMNNKIRVTIEGALLPPCYENMSVNRLNVWIQLVVLKETSRKIKPSNIFLTQNVSEVWEVALVPEKLIDVVPEVTHKKTFHLKSIKIGDFNTSFLEVRLSTNMKTNFPLSVAYNLQPINTDSGIIYAGLVLIGLYVLIIFELVHRTLAAMLASTMSVAILAALNARPTMGEIISWIDVETLLLLFSMMTLVTIFSETGIFDYMAVFAYKITGGKIWPLINILCVITAIFSCFLDNVTTTLLTTPVTIKLCEVMKLNPVPVLMYMLIFANIGGAITPIGDPPNVIIASNPDVIRSALSRLGLIDWVGKQTQAVIMSVDQDSRLTVAIILILWVSGFASAFVDNLPLTTMMIRIATNLADNRELNLPLQPLIWALSFGACLGVALTVFRRHSHYFSCPDCVPETLGSFQLPWLCSEDPNTIPVSLTMFRRPRHYSSFLDYVPETVTLL